MSQSSPEATADGERSCFRRFRYNNDRSWFKYFRFSEDRDSRDDARHVLLVVVTLIAGVTFQAGVNPPGGVWQDDKDGHTAGRAIYGSNKIAFYVFLISNTVALSTSIFVILSLTYRFPFRLEVWMATVSMLTTYGSAIVAVTPHELVKFRYILLAASAPGVLRVLVEVCRAVKHKSSS